ncbi:MAG: cysteine-rich CWC family protein [Fluviibacter sp.]
MPPIDEHQCPLCGENNACGAHSATPCWCCSTGIPQALIDLVPADKHMKACICKRCVDRFNQSQQQQQ